MLPGITYSIALNHNEFENYLKELVMYDKEIGVPYWFCDKYNVYGCTATIQNINVNRDKGFSRLKVMAKSIFRLTTYSKNANTDLPNHANVELISLSDHYITNPTVIENFLLLTNSKKETINLEMNLLDILRWLNLKPELTFAIISKNCKQEREDLLNKILNFYLSIGVQSSIYEHN